MQVCTQDFDALKSGGVSGDDKDNRKNIWEVRR